MVVNEASSQSGETYSGGFVPPRRALKTSLTLGLSTWKASKTESHCWASNARGRGHTTTPVKGHSHFGSGAPGTGYNPSEGGPRTRPTHR